jgi:hypothetical protein
VDPFRDPSISARVEQHVFELRDRERVELVIEAPVTRLLKGDGQAVIDERRAPYYAERRGEQHPSCICTHAVIGGTADQEVALFEGVREREGSPEFLIVHALNRARVPDAPSGRDMQSVNG